jgi:hypothetical protein
MLHHNVSAYFQNLLTQNYFIAETNKNDLNSEKSENKLTESNIN